MRKIMSFILTVCGAINALIVIADGIAGFFTHVNAQDTFRATVLMLLFYIASVAVSHDSRWESAKPVRTVARTKSRRCISSSGG